MSKEEMRPASSFNRAPIIMGTVFIMSHRAREAGRFTESVEKAHARIQLDIIQTPLEYSPLLSLAFGPHIYFKWECAQLTGSFKFRGALNKLRTLSSAQKRRGVVSASTGNHGLGLSRAARIEGVTLLLYLPENAAPAKIAKLRKAGAVLKFFGTSCEKTEIHARSEAETSGRVFISPYNDLEIIRGQGTVGLEILDQLPGVEDVFVPVGGGGLIAGIAGYLKGRTPGVRVFGVEPAHSAFMKAAFKAGRLVEIKEKPTLADAVAGGIEPGSVTLPLCRRTVDEILTVSEKSLAAAMRLIREVHGKVVEGAGALALAGMMKQRGRFRGRKVVLVASGGNISPRRFKSICGANDFQI